ncbi:MAG: DUF1573 domain-containing protein [FCB group bacterium]|nr:DUF1573 domain-containing protein [FCB group bacterium]
MASIKRIPISMIVALVLAGLLSPASAQDDNVTIRPRSWDFGFLPQKSEVGQRFYLINTGSDSLPVDRIKAGCSCTSVSQINHPIAPGDSAAIDILFKSGRYHKRTKKATQIFISESQQQIYSIWLKAYVYKKKESPENISITPQKLQWEVKDGKISDSSTTLEFFNSGPDTLKVVVLHSSGELVQSIDLPRDIVHDAKEELLINATALPVDKDFKGGSITFGFIGADTTIVTVPIELEK